LAQRALCHGGKHWFLWEAGGPERYRVLFCFLFFRCGVETYLFVLVDQRRLLVFK
jgi:hypothetical protein